MSYRSDRFNARMRSLDTMAEGLDVSKWPLLSDNGKGADAIRESTYRDMWIEAARERAIRAERAERLFVAEMRLVEANLRHLVPVLLLIVDNGSNFRESIARIPRRTYFRHRAQLLAFFAA